MRYTLRRVDLRKDARNLQRFYAQTCYLSEPHGDRSFEQCYQKWRAAGELKHFLSLLRGTLRKGTGFVDMIEDKHGQAIGYVWVRISGKGERRHAEVEEIYVVDAFRRCGIGSYVLGEVQRKAKAAGVCALRAGMAAANRRSEKFFRRNGFGLRRLEFEKRL